MPEISLNFAPEEKGLESLARQIKLTGRAYPIFDIAHLILKKPDRYHVTFGVVKKADGQTAQPLWVCNLDDTLWLSEPDAVNHVLRKHFDTFYKADRTPTDSAELEAAWRAEAEAVLAVEPAPEAIAGRSSSWCW